MPTIESAILSNKDKRMWGLDLDYWNEVLIWSLAAAAIAAFFVVVSTLAVIRLQKAAEIETTNAFEQYKLETGKEIAEANAKQREAELKLEELRTKVVPRHLNGEAFKKALEGKPKAPVEIMFPREDGEAFMLAIQFRDVLRASDWQAAEPVPVPDGDVPRLVNQPSVTSVGAQPIGVTVVIRADTQAEMRAVSDLQSNTPLNALGTAIWQALGSATRAAAGPEVYHVPPSGTLRIVVAPKP